MAGLLEEPWVFIGGREYGETNASAVLPFGGLDQHRKVRLQWTQLGKERSAAGREVTVREDGVVFATMPVPLNGLSSTTVLMVELVDTEVRHGVAVWQQAFRVERDPIRLVAAD